jgi:hypothetical protein
MGPLMKRAFGPQVVLVLVTGLAGVLASLPALLLISPHLNEILGARAANIAARTALADGQTRRHHRHDPAPDRSDRRCHGSRRGHRCHRITCSVRAKN